MRPTLGLPVARFLDTLEIVAKEGKHLSYSWSSLFNQAINVQWVVSLEQNHRCAEQLEVDVKRRERLHYALGICTALIRIMNKFDKCVRQCIPNTSFDASILRILRSN